MSTIDIAVIQAGTHTCTTLPLQVPDILTTQQDPTPPPNCGMFKVLTAQDGDRRIIWNRLILDEIRAAKKMFLDLVDKGLVPYKVGTGGRPSADIMKVFDASAEEVVFLPVNVARGG